MQQLWKKIGLSLLILFLLPIGITVGISGKESIKGELKFDLEAFLPILMCQQMDWNYEEEVLKAQAVLARSSLSLCIQNETWTALSWRNLMRDHKNHMKTESYKIAYEKMKNAAKNTQGEILTYKNSICEGVFHKVSGGFTRNGTEILQNISYEYLTRVESEHDVKAENYLQGHFFSKEALMIRIQSCYPDADISKEDIFQQIQIVERDTSDYVTKIKVGNKMVSGEEFRVNLELASSNFTMQEVNGKIRFLCKGMGHGLGMSQFGANELAKEGNTYLEILNYYFPQAKINKL